MVAESNPTVDAVPAWVPSADIIQHANITQLLNKFALSSVKALHTWSITHVREFWQQMLLMLQIQFKQSPTEMLDLSQGMESPIWLPGAKMNIIDSCFNAPDNQTAIVYEDQGALCQLSFGELNQFSNQIANGLVAQGIEPGDAIAIAMPMNKEAVATYLGIIKMGGVVVSIADSFSAEEMAVRLNIANTKAIFTQDMIHWGGKCLPLFDKVKNASAVKAIVLGSGSAALREQDVSWDNFLSKNTHFDSVAADPMTATNILFSSGTTAQPKAIVWNHTTPIKAASDACLHQNIQARDVLAWPTNLGWMMGPWLIYAAFINQAAIALYPDVPKDRKFGEFIARANVTMLGVVPTLVAVWHQSHCMEGLDWHHIKVFSSTGECSNAEDMAYLMSLAGNKPVIEYCGGTEIGGAYLSSTVIEKNYPAQFTTPTMGMNIGIIDEEGHPADHGSVTIIPPSMGLSTVLLNGNHHQVYYDGMPLTPHGQLQRRHGDEIIEHPNGCYSILGRSDDTMNLGGIKISAAEIERSLSQIDGIIEVAAIATSPPNGGPSLLIIFAVTHEQLDKELIKKIMQKRINQSLNPLFKIADVVFVNELPKTASNKIMRRLLRQQCLTK